MRPLRSDLQVVAHQIQERGQAAAAEAVCQQRHALLAVVFLAVDDEHAEPRKSVGPPDNPNPPTTTPHSSDLAHLVSSDVPLLRGGSDDEEAPASPYSSLQNFRDVADGVPALRRGLLFRCGQPDECSSADLARLEELGLKRWIDLRSEPEAKRGQGSSWRLAFEGRRVALPGLIDNRKLVVEKVGCGGVCRALSKWACGGGLPVAARFVVGRVTGGEADLRNMYIEMLRSPDLPRALAHATDAECLPLAWNCSAGKDRTGVLSALVLGALGVPSEVIVADYARSEAARKRLEAMARRRLKSDEMVAALAPILAAPPEAMRALLEHIQREHGSMEALLDSLGVGPERRAAMRAACLVDQV